MKKTFNIGILAHVDAGKTSITEQILNKCGVLRNAGSVDSGTTVTDYMSVERRRGISVRTACAFADYRDNEICIVDTPGHIDFASEVERSLSVLDGAVLVVSAVDGIQTYTRMIWKALRHLSIPTIIVLNKIDRVGSDTASVFTQLTETFGENFVAIQEITGEGSDSASVSKDFAAYLKENEGNSLPVLAQFDEELEEKFLSDETATKEELMKSLENSARKGDLYPVLYTSAKNGTGIESLLDAICQFLPDSSQLKKDELSGIVFKVERDETMGKAAYIRLFGGSISSRSPIMIGETEEKVSQIRRYSGRKFSDIGTLEAGQIGTVYGLSGIKNGDIIGSVPEGRNCSIAVPLLLSKVFANKEEEQQKLMHAVSELADEDPLLDFKFSQETREIYVSITGTVQLEILSELIRDRYGLEVSFSEPTVIYKETPKRAAIGIEEYTMPKPCWACVELLVEPLPRGSGIVYESVIKDNIIPYRYQNHIDISVHQTLSQGILGWEVTDAKITLVGGSHHFIHTHPLDFFVATPVAFLRALQAGGSTLLEPIMRVTLSADESLLGKVLGQIIDMRGEFDSPVLSGGNFMLEAAIPAATSLDYPSVFRSLTSGKGLISREFLEYRECPLELGKTMPRRGFDPLDWSKWLLYCRNALK